MSPIIEWINLLDSTFTTSFRHTASELYYVKFESSSILETREKIIELEKNFKNGKKSNKHVGFQIALSDITIVKETLNSLIEVYLASNQINVLPSRLKLHEMTRDLRVIQDEKDIFKISETVARNVLAPVSTDKKLSKKQRIEQEAIKQSQQNKLDMIKKLKK